MDTQAHTHTYTCICINYACIDTCILHIVNILYASVYSYTFIFEVPTFECENCVLPGTMRSSAARNQIVQVQFLASENFKLGLFFCLKFVTLAHIGRSCSNSVAETF